MSTETEIKELKKKVKILEEKINQQTKRCEQIYLIVEEYLLDLNLNARVKNLEEKIKK
jgi:hypothetical protein